MIAPDLLTAIGEALYGSPWQSKMAAALGRDARTIRRWLEGTRHPGEGDCVRLLHLAQDRRVQLDGVIAELRGDL